MKKLFELSQYLADDAKNISDRIFDLSTKDAIPINAIAQDIAELMHEYAKLRIDLMEAEK